MVAKMLHKKTHTFTINASNFVREKFKKYNICHPSPLGINFANLNVSSAEFQFAYSDIKIELFCKYLRVKMDKFGFQTQTNHAKKKLSKQCRIFS